MCICRIYMHFQFNCFVHRWWLHMRAYAAVHEQVWRVWTAYTIGTVSYSGQFNVAWQRLPRESLMHFGCCLIESEQEFIASSFQFCRFVFLYLTPASTTATATVQERNPRIYIYNTLTDHRRRIKTINYGVWAKWCWLYSCFRCPVYLYHSDALFFLAHSVGELRQQRIKRGQKCCYH